MFFSRGDLVFIAAASPSEPGFERQQRHLLQAAEEGRVVAGEDFRVLPLCEGASLSPDLCAVRPVVSVGASQRASEVFVAQHPRAWLCLALPGHAEQRKLPLSEHTTLRHVLDALAALRLTPTDLAGFSVKASHLAQPPVFAIQCDHIDDTPMYKLLHLDYALVDPAADNEIQIRLSLEFDKDPPNHPPPRSMSDISTSTAFEDAPTDFPPPSSPPRRPAQSDDLSRLEHASSAHDDLPASEKDPSQDQPIREPRQPVGIVGLSNLGNSCYMNSGLQCLLQTPQLVTYFLATRFDTPEEAVDAYFTNLSPGDWGKQSVKESSMMRWRNDLNVSNPLGSKGYVAMSFARLVRNLWLRQALAEVEERQRSASSLDTLGGGVGFGPPATHIAPKVLKKHVGAFNESFQGYEQQDSQEFVQVLLDALHEDLKSAPRAAVPLPPTASPSALPIDGLSIEPTSSTSPIASIFQGSLRSHIECQTCHTTSIKIDPYTLLSLPISNPIDGPCSPPPLKTFIRAVSFNSDDPKTDTNVFHRLRVTVQNDWSILDLKHHVATQCAWSCPPRTEKEPTSATQQPRTIIVYHVDRNRIVRVFSDWELASEAVLDDSEDRDYPTDGIVVCHLAKIDVDPSRSPTEEETPLMHVPVLFHCKRFFGTPTYLSFPTVRTLQMRVPTLLQYLDEFNRLYRDMYWQQAGDLLYTDIVNQLTTLHLTQWPLFRPKRFAAITGDLIAEAKQNLEYGSREERAEAETKLHKVFELCARSLLSAEQLQQHPEMVPIENMFKVTLFTGQSLEELGGGSGSLDERRRVEARDAFAAGGWKRGGSNRVHAYPTDEPGFEIWRDRDPEAWEIASETWELEGCVRQNFKVDELMDSRCDVFEEMLRMDNEVIVVVDFEREIAELMFGEDGREMFEPKDHESMRVRTPPPCESDAPAASYTLDNCLQEFSKEELMSMNDLWFCSECKELKQIKKKLEIQEAPEILIFHLKRFASSGGSGGFESSSSRKIEVLVDFPVTGFDMSAFMSSQSVSVLDEAGAPVATEGLTNLYDLYAVSNHMGGLGGGHYTAFVHSATDAQWYHMDDNRATVVSAQDVVTSSAYLLFYKRRSIAGEEEERRGVRESWEQLKRVEEMIAEHKRELEEELERLAALATQGNESPVSPFSAGPCSPPPIDAIVAEAEELDLVESYEDVVVVEVPALRSEESTSAITDVSISSSVASPVTVPVHAVSRVAADLYTRGGAVVAGGGGDTRSPSVGSSSKRVKVSASCETTEDTQSNVTVGSSAGSRGGSVGSSSMHSGICSPLEHDAVHLMEVVGGGVRGGGATELEGHAVQTILNGAAGVVVSPNGSTGKRTRQTSDS
ncbi:CSN-associated deubiquitinating enzyme Ubp12 [Podochytrium sp. JEL0797]|nr:CSN-associated deubiquitinating enzyme Ubp12 [Podochytrium sp. JEL0797]